MNNMLYDLALAAAQKSYSKYSGFSVGAALLCCDGSIFTGCNIENSSYGATVCAERTAFFKAISEGKTDFKEIAICTLKNGQLLDNSFLPCGICRQVFCEFCNENFVINIISKDRVKQYTLSQLMPSGFILGEYYENV